MRYCIFIFSFTIGYVFNGFSQITIESKKIIIDNAFVQFFQQHSSVKEIGFSIYGFSDSASLTIVEQQINGERERESYDLNHKGDRYSFEKRYGKFEFPSSVYKNYIDTRAISRSIYGRVRYDSVYLNISHGYEKKYQEPDDEKLFIKVEQLAEYEKGITSFTKEMEHYFQGRKFNEFPADSVVIVFALINKDKTIVVDTILEGSSSFAESIVEFINKSGPWKPAEACGRLVRAYKKIYARLNSDNSFDVEIY
jgi:hypothetical protein